MMGKYNFKAGLLFIVVLAFSSLTLAQTKPFKDTLQLSIDDVDKLFLKNNLLLLASQYDIESAKAQIIQERLYANPNVYFEQNIYNPSTKKYFDASKNGEFILQASQLIQLAGKRNKRIKMSETNAQLAEYQFYDLIRTLKYEVHINFIELFFLQNSYHTFNEQISTIRNTVDLYQKQYEKRNIALKEVTRLKAFLLDLENDRRDLYAQIITRIGTLHILLNNPSDTYIIPVVEKSVLDSISINQLNYHTMLDSARSNRFDLKAYKGNITLEQQNLAYQKSLAVPDIQVGGVYDRNGNYIPNYYALSLQIDLPVLNRNQGNIKIAQKRVEKSKALTNEFENRVESEVMQAYSKAIEYNELYLNFDKKFTSEFQSLIDGILKNYEKKNITLIEFIDFYESYKNSVMSMNQLQMDRISSFEELNYTIGKSLITY